MVTVQVEESEIPHKGNHVCGNREISQTYAFYRSQPSHETVMLKLGVGLDWPIEQE